MNLADGTEIREVPGLDGRYFASEDGRIWSSKRRKFRTASMQHNGYLTITVRNEVTRKTTTLSVHRLVALAWIPNHQNLPQVNHKDGVKTNNRPSNLEWCTAQHNSQHAWESGLVTLTEPMRNGLLVGQEQQSARAAAKEQERLAARKDELSKYEPGRKRLPSKVVPVRRISAEQLQAARIRIERGEMQKDIAKEYGVSKALLSTRLTELKNKEVAA